MVIIRTLQDLQVFSSSFNWKEFACDTETTDLDYFKLDIVGISLYDGKNLAYIDLWENPEKREFLYHFWSNLQTSQILIGQNLVFDIKVFTKVFNLGQQATNLLLKNTKLIDTMLASYLIDERTPHNLKYLVEVHLKKNHVTFTEVQKFGYNSVEFTSAMEIHAKNTWDLWQIFKPMLKEQQLEQVFDIECNFIPVQVEMELTGIELDTELLKQQETFLDLLKCQLEEEMTESLGYNKVYQERFWEKPENVNPVDYGSSAQVAKMIQKRLKIKLTVETDKGKDGRKSVKDEVIKGLLEKHKFFPLYQKYKAVTKLLNTYCSKYWDLIKPDGRIHPEYHIRRSGRAYISKPNLGNQAKENDLVSEVNVRNLIVSKI